MHAYDIIYMMNRKKVYLTRVYMYNLIFKQYLVKKNSNKLKFVNLTLSMFSLKIVSSIKMSFVI